MAGKFVVKKITDLNKVEVNYEIPESDYSTLTPEGKFVQLTYVEDKSDPVPFKVEPGIFSIMRNTSGFYLEKTKFTEDKILEDFVNTREIEDKADCFFRNTHKYAELGIDVAKRNMLLFGPPGCHAACTEILMYDGTLKKVEDVQVNDLLMGPDSKARKVLELATGKESMVRINPIKGESFTVNVNHILHLTPSGETHTKTPINIKFSDLLNESKCFQERYKLTRTGVDFISNEVPVDPYIIGSWLGDGTSENISITSVDTEIKDYWKEFAKKQDLQATITLDRKIERIAVSSGKSFTGMTLEKRNKVLTKFQELNLINNKHIPLVYKTASRKDRLELLAGLIDTDGHLDYNCYDYISSSKQLADDITYLVRSLGLAAYQVECQKGCMYKGEYKEGTYYRISISGDCSVIPVKLGRKKASKREQIKNVLRTGFTYELLPEDKYYGFSLNGDHLYLTGDFTIHHNTGKTTSIAKVCNKYLAKGDTTVVIFQTEKFEAFEVKDFIKSFSYEGVNRLILVMEDVGGVEMEEVRRGADAGLLSLLDNQEKTLKIPTLIIATTNFPEVLMGALTNRPGRFDDKIKAGFPKPEARAKLAEFFAKRVLTEIERSLLVAKSADSFTPAHIKEAIVRSVIHEKTLEVTIKEVLKEIEEYNKAFKEAGKELGFGS